MPRIRRARDSSRPDRPERVHALQRGRGRDDRPVGQPQPLGEVVAEAVGVDPRDEHGRGQHDDEHPEGHGEGGVQVAAGEEPGRPADRERRDESGQHPHGDPAGATGRPGTPARGGQSPTTASTSWLASTARLVVQCGDSTPAGTASSAATSRASGPQRATSGIAVGGGGGPSGAEGSSRWTVVARSTTWASWVAATTAPPAVR